MKKRITILDPVHCKADKEAREIIKHALAYKGKFWKDKDNGYGKELILQNQFLITGRIGTGGHFFTGLLSRVKRYCRQRKIKLKVISNNLERIRPYKDPNLKGITFRKDQLAILKKIRIAHRGKIIAPTGSGKTIIALGIISMFTNKRTILLMHTKDLCSQAISEARKFQKNLPPIYAPSGSHNLEIDLKSIRKRKNALLICLIQSLSKINPSEYIDLFDITIIDECHHVTNMKSMYGNFMQNNLSPRRYGLTATNDFKEQKDKLINEGLIGPVIGQLTNEQALEDKIIAKPKVNLISIPHNIEISKAAGYKYADNYLYGIVENKYRNGIIGKLIKNSEDKKIPTLTIVEKLEHGKNIQKLLDREYRINIPFVQGQNSMTERNSYKQLLLDEKIYNVIASRVWMEGINIPNLRVIIYAAGYKEKKKVIQAMGRGLRTSEGKEKIILYDFADPYKYLAEHAIQRIQVFIENGWL